MRNGISAVLIVKNEEAVLDRCLASLAGCDEIVVLDTGSTDRTVEIAKAHTSNVMITPPIEPFHFAEARNRADRLARQDWILTIDADEVLEEGSIWAIRRTVRSRSFAAGFRVAFNFAGEDGANKTSLMKLKIYRRGVLVWAFRVHEQLFPVKEDGKVFDLPDVVMTHLPSVEKEARRRQNVELLKMSVSETPGYLRNWRQLGMELYLMEKYEEALPNLEKYLEASGIDPLDRSETRVHIARSMAKLGRTDDALAQFEAAFNEAPVRREPLMYKALALINVARLDEALVDLKRLVQIPETSKPDFHLNVDAIWDGSLPQEAAEFCHAQIAEAKRKWYETKAGER